MTTLAFAKQTKNYYYYQLFKESGKYLKLKGLPQRPHSKACYNEASQISRLLLFNIWEDSKMAVALTDP